MRIVVMPRPALSAVPPAKFDLDPMYVRLRDKYLNAVDELGNSRSVASDVFKGVITGNPRDARDVYKPAEEIVPVALLIWVSRSNVRKYEQARGRDDDGNGRSDQD